MQSPSVALASLCSLVLAATPVRAADAANKGFLTLKRDIVVRDAGCVPLPAVRVGDRYPSPGFSDAGFLLVCRDANGAARLARVPVRDGWGHVTARHASYDASLPPDTLEIREPATMRPGAVILRAGERFPVADTTGESHMLVYAFGGFERRVEVVRDDAVFEPPPPPERNPARLRELKLANELAALRAEQETLDARLRIAEEDCSRAAALRRDLADVRSARDEKAADLARNEAVYAALTAPPDPHKATRETLRTELKTARARQAGLAATLENARLDTETLTALREQAIAADTALERLRTDVAVQEAELGALLTDARDPAARAPIEQARNVTAAAAREAATLKMTALDLETFAWVRPRMEAALRANAELQERVATLRRELDALKAALNPPQPEPTTEDKPEETPAEKPAEKPDDKPDDKPAQPANEP